jgi:ribulose-5-phosphate 4-epimerase/fuculose-1-phosphate aldolase
MQIKKTIVDIARYLASRGWAEAGSGNISYKCDFDLQDQYQTEILKLEARPGLKAFVTRSGSLFRKLMKRDVGIVDVQPDRWTIRHSFEEGQHPTSELLSHLLSHGELFNTEYKAIIHVHPTYIMALIKRIKSKKERNVRIMTTNYKQIDIQEIYNARRECDIQKEINDLILNCTSEVMHVIENEIGFVYTSPPGSPDLAQLTASHVKENRRVIIWDNHGLVAIGKTLDEACNMIEIIEKSSQILLHADIF